MISCSLLVRSPAQPDTIFSQKFDAISCSFLVCHVTHDSWQWTQTRIHIFFWTPAKRKCTTFKKILKIKFSMWISIDKHHSEEYEAGDWSARKNKHIAVLYKHMFTCSLSLFLYHFCNRILRMWEFQLQFLISGSTTCGKMWRRSEALFFFEGKCVEKMLLGEHHKFPCRFTQRQWENPECKQTEILAAEMHTVDFFSGLFSLFETDKSHSLLGIVHSFKSPSLKTMIWVSDTIWRVVLRVYF